MYYAIVLAVLSALFVCLLLFLREVFLAVASPRHPPQGAAVQEP